MGNYGKMSKGKNVSREIGAITVIVARDTMTWIQATSGDGEKWCGFSIFKW